MRNIDLIWLKEIDSTNSLAARELLANPDIPQWRVWAAEYQTAGKGQRGNRWVGEPGCNLAFTILLRPHNLPAVKQFALSQVCALGVCNYLERYHNISAEIKWPNDIYVGNGKICGMLRCVKAYGIFCCFGTQLVNTIRQISSPGRNFSGFLLCIFNSLITGYSSPLFNYSSSKLDIYLLR